MSDVLVYMASGSIPNICHFLDLETPIFYCQGVLCLVCIAEIETAIHGSHSIEPPIIADLLLQTRIHKQEY